MGPGGKGDLCGSLCWGLGVNDSVIDLTLQLAEDDTETLAVLSNGGVATILPAS